MLLWGVLVVLVIESALGLDRYVDSVHGSDSNAGTSAGNAWKTVGFAKQAIQTLLPAQVTVHVAAGMYYVPDGLVLDENDSGSAEGMVEWQGPQRTPLCSRSGNSMAASCQNLTSSEFAVVSTGIPVVNWRLIDAEKRIYAGSLASTPMHPPTDLFDAKGTWRMRARAPAPGQFLEWADTLCPNVRVAPCSSIARWGFVYAAGDLLDSYSQPDLTYFKVYHGWTASLHALREIIPTNHTVLLQNPSDRPIGFWPRGDSEGGGRYVVEAIEYLDEPGEWFFNATSHQVLYIPEVGESEPQDGDFFASGHSNVLTLAGAHDITFSGLSFRHASWVCNFGGQQVCDSQSTNWQDYATVHVTNGSTRVEVVNSEVSGSGGYGIWVESASNVNIQGNYVREMAAGGLRLGTNTGHCGRAPSNSSYSRASHVTMSSNVVSHGGLTFASGTGVLVQFAINSTLSHNEVRRLAYAGFSVGWCWGYQTSPTLSGTAAINVSHNYVHGLGLPPQRELGDAMAAFYTLGEQPGTVFANNVGTQVFASYTGGYGLSQDQSSSYITFENNLLASINAALQTQHYGLENVYRNNIFAFGYVDSRTNQNSPGVRHVCPPDSPSSFTFERNIVVTSPPASEETSLFEGNYINRAGASHLNVSFANNIWWNYNDPNAASKAIWGGCNQNCGPDSGSPITFVQWQRGCGTDSGSSPSKCTGPKQDVGSKVADPRFADPLHFNFTLLPDSPAQSVGFIPWDYSAAGILMEKE